MIHRIYLLIVCTLLFSGCASVFNFGHSRPDIVLRPDFNGDGIAVLTFSAQGSYLRSDAGIIAADRFSEEMFLQRRFNVIDRARVNRIALDLEIKSGENLSNEQIREVGRRLDANYIAVGKLFQETEPFQFIDDIDKTLTVSIRLMDTETAEMVGVARYTVSYKDEYHNTIKMMMNRIARRMR